jgi:DNA-binding CsgD family transcriptional regulator
LDLLARLDDVALLDGAHWRQTMTELVRSLGAHSGWLLRRGGAGARLDILASTGLSAAAIAAYQDGYWRRDPWLEAAARLPVDAPPLYGARPSPSSFDAEGFPAEFLYPHLGEGVRVMAAGLPVPDGTRAAIILYRADTAGPFEAAAIAALSALLPALRRAVRVRVRAGAVELQRDHALAALDLLPVPLMLVDGAGQIAFSNHAADAVLLLADGLLRTHSGHLAGVSPDALAGAAAGESVSLRVGRRGAAAGWLVQVCPLGGLADPAAPRLALVLIGDPERDPAPADAALRSAWSLTPAEAGVARGVVQGLTVGEVAARQGVAPATVRSRLSSVLAKTRTSGRADLARLLLALPTVLPCNG